MSSVRIYCPHCEEEIRVDLSLKAMRKKRKGPAPYNPGPEVDAFVIEAIDVKNFSLNTVAELLRDRGIPSSKGTKNWYSTSVKRFYIQALKRKEEEAE